MRTALEVIMDVESELALHGYADPCTSLFRGCHLCFLPLHKPQHQPQPAIASDAPHASQPAAVSTAAGSRLFQSTVDAAKTVAVTQAALLDCHVRRVALQVRPHVCPARQMPTSSTPEESVHDESAKCWQHLGTAAWSSGVIRCQNQCFHHLYEQSCISC